MLGWFKTRAQARRKAEELYGAVVAAARTPLYFRDLSVPDTPEGRFEMVALMLYLVLDRLKTAPGGVDLTRGTIEAFVTDMDDCMREMGVGDVVVPKRVRRAAAAFYERSGAYRAAVKAADEPALAALFEQYVYRGASPGAALLAGHVLEIARRLNAVPDAVAMTGDVPAMLGPIDKGVAA